MYRKELRLKILFRLYYNYYENTARPLVTQNLKNEEEFTYIDPKQFYGDIIYLKNKGLINGTDVLGLSYPYTISISPLGIELVETTIDEYKLFLKSLKEKDDSEASQILAQIEAVEKTAEFTTVIKNIILEIWKRDNSRITNQFLLQYKKL